MTQKGDYRNLLFLVSFCLIGIILTGLSISLDSKLDGSDCKSELILWCNRAIFIIALVITGITLMSIIFNARGIDGTMSIKETGTFYGSYGILLIVLGAVVLILTSIMLGEYNKIKKQNSAPATKSGSNICKGLGEMIGLIVASVIFIGLGVGMTFISFNLKNTDRK